ncbi:MarR family transcriptional regulator [Echinicola pacifica]|uniref:HTH-type transcriptional regulator SarZ n=1 Tax=Echinicola pacifica TaxID=346377 RepID=A0A918UTU6_9BACT|nr:MarR family transcriptional regulator [Echinicola pacifica]GGZ32689.1 MarR family transcriptional regulator [Echinicola pacifica]
MSLEEKSPSNLLLENQLCFPLYAASRLMIKAYQPHLSKLDLTYPQYLVMLVLWEKDKLTVTEISKLLLLESNTLTPLLKRMEEKGLISRQRDTMDERKVFVMLSTDGRAMRQDAACIPTAILKEVDVLSIEEMKELYSHLGKVLNHLR